MTDPRDGAAETTVSPADTGSPRRLPALLRHGLSARLLWLTVLFVMLAEVLIYLPSISRFRLVYLEERLGQCHLALLGLEASPDGMVDMQLQESLLSMAGAIGMTARRPYQPTLMLGPDMPDHVKAVYDLRRYPVWRLIRDAMATMLAGGQGVIAVQGWSPKDGEVMIEAFIPEAPLREAMLDYSGRILLLSLGISLFSAALVYLSLHLLLVRPLRRLTANMAAFRAAPDDPGRVIVPSGRTDEVGMAEESLQAMQVALRDALTQRARLAGVGTAVAKVTHDLKGILTTALLESDRLEASSADPEVKAVTQGIAQAVDRAVTLCASTLRFAKEGPPEARPRRVSLGPVIEAAVADCSARFPDLVWSVATEEDGRGPVDARADPSHLGRILGNLLTNAGEAGARTGTVLVERRTATVPGAGLRRWVAVTIRDDGPGLPERARNNLFKPFSGSARAGGTGLGLPIAQELARAQGGGLELVKTGAEGTEFRVDLPTP